MRTRALAERLAAFLVNASNARSLDSDSFPRQQTSRRSANTHQPAASGVPLLGPLPDSPPPTPTSVPGLSAADPGRQKRSGITEGDDWPWTAVGPTRRNSRWRTPMRWFDSANRILPESTHSNAGLSIGASGSPIALAQSEDGLSQSGSRASNR
eukprot:GHVU01086928.1.p1 GENE.GHVU01086928.1~~GHVU01086928.1.p1  ORF type:complete len:154 (+),score=6.05 GHVU01086928.1:291-752(+)